VSLSHPEFAKEAPLVLRISDSRHQFVPPPRQQLADIGGQVHSTKVL
jgi:hypothetical protein